ncbi:TonB-dependent receptor [Catenovulum agarivorans DS-2]|uniref:TonB-dependent receptor n=1 Tax=Catenovulum agarivorans DS-2 TaxID=1328313 RepID=W7Q776_9ALTE|nr:TonB-dependent receptor [Catenovulum agarivorans]EWH08619.1 TonB-dependent receptor [Catenovulum agarivorans DS-2]
MFSPRLKPKYLVRCISLAFLTVHYNAFGEESHLDPQVQAIEVIRVTSTKRTQNMQSVPIALQVLTEQTLDELKLSNLDALNLYLPNVSVATRGPGQADIFMRGMAIQPIAVMLSGAQGAMPNVAVYLDEQPVTAPGRNIDVYTHDLARVEVLAGPQGTLFGGSSQAGTVRYISNKPQKDSFDANVSADLATTKNGSHSHTVQAMLNIPLADSFAFRISAYDVLQGGYIDNTHGVFSIDPKVNDKSALEIEGASFQNADNRLLVEDNFNQSVYRGYRAAAQYWIEDNWRLLLQHNAQQIEADGVFDMDPQVGDLEVERYFPDQLEDEFTQSALTMSGRLEALQLLYTGSVLSRQVNQSIDYTGYNNTSAYVAYYTCTYSNPNYIVNYNIPASFITENRQCKDPTKGFVGKQSHDKKTHEFRLVYDQSANYTAVVGMYFDKFTLETQDDYVYVAAPELGFAPNAPISTANSIDPNTRPAGVTFFNDVTRRESQRALFAEVTLALAPKLSATIGARKYTIESDLTGSSNFADGIFQGSVNTDRGRDYDVSGGHSKQPLTQSDSIYKFNLNYQWQNNKLIYATYSEGFRPGGFNRGGGIQSANPEFPNVATTYDTDDATNYELGLKSSWLNNRMRLNANAYRINWHNMQVSRFDPQNVSILTFIENAADSTITGLETDLAWQVTDYWQLHTAVAVINSKLTNIKARAIELVPEGSELPLTPKIKGNIRSQYSWPLGQHWVDWHVSWIYSHSAWSSLVAEQREQQDGYHIVNTSVSLEAQSWQAQLYINNLTDERAELFINDQDDIRRVTVNRPLTLGVKVKYRF